MRATSPIDVMLGEVGGRHIRNLSPEQRRKVFEDHAQVIANRARAMGVSPEDVVASRSEFNAYGKSLPGGMSQYRSEAQQAFNRVMAGEADNRVGDAMFFATPAAQRNLPRGLESVGVSSGGHNFFRDPQERSIRTAQGFRPVDFDRLPSPLDNLSATPTPRPTMEPEMDYRSPRQVAQDFRDPMVRRAVARAANQWDQSRGRNVTDRPEPLPAPRSTRSMPAPSRSPVDVAQSPERSLYGQFDRARAANQPARADMAPGAAIPSQYAMSQLSSRYDGPGWAPGDVSNMPLTDYARPEFDRNPLTGRAVALHSNPQSTPARRAPTTQIAQRPMISADAPIRRAAAAQTAVSSPAIEPDRYIPVSPTSSPASRPAAQPARRAAPQPTTLLEDPPTPPVADKLQVNPRTGKSYADIDGIAAPKPDFLTTPAGNTPASAYANATPPPAAAAANRVAAQYDRVNPSPQQQLARPSNRFAGPGSSAASLRGNPNAVVGPFDKGRRNGMLAGGVLGGWPGAMIGYAAGPAIGRSMNHGKDLDDVVSGRRTTQPGLAGRVVDLAQFDRINQLGGLNARDYMFDPALARLAGRARGTGHANSGHAVNSRWDAFRLNPDLNDRRGGRNQGRSRGIGGVLAGLFGGGRSRSRDNDERRGGRAGVRSGNPRFA